MTASVKIAILGLGETALEFAYALKQAGADVSGYDATKPKHPPIPVAESAEIAVADADVVLSINSSAGSIRVAESVANALKSGAVYADLNSGTPSLKRKLAEVLPADSFVDAAVMPAPQAAGQQWRLSVSGAGAERFIEAMAGYGMGLEFVSQQAGDATARRLLRDLMDKGIASVLADTLWAAKALGLEDWAIEEIKNEFSASNEVTVQSYLDETGKNPKRRSVEVGDLSEVLAEAGYESTMLNGMGLTFSHIMHGRRIPFADLDD